MADVVRTSIGVRDGKVAAISPDLGAEDADEVVDGGGRLAFPGVVDAHQHRGIYNELGADVASESRACAQGGVTTALTYMRTGQHYLNKGGDYATFFPEVLETGRGRAHVDYGFHLAPMMRGHVEEIPELVEAFGVPSFKVFMFYGSHGLRGKSKDQSSFLMIPEGERYDYAHFEFVMRGIQAARERFPELADFRTAHGLGGKVNPPLRDRDDVEALWEYVADGTIDWVVSDHACCRDETKFGDPREDVFVAESGFGGTEYLPAGLVTGGLRRGLPMHRVAELVSANPARRCGLRTKGDLDVGYDADIALVDPDHPWVVRAEDSESTQEYTPFEGFELTARVTDTFLRGRRILQDGEVVGEPAGRYLSRPTT
ncbi:dihydroorotase family protein [Saccharothrix sp. BKS2]|uniref:dihydroorotase n=1 Tax=Saccharothrix sp. BKS2 TaxID=3064400 RepID=UPI0039EB2D8F